MLRLGSNPDLTVICRPHLAHTAGAAGLPFALGGSGQRHRELPFMYGDALVPESCFDGHLVDEPPLPFPLFRATEPAHRFDRALQSRST